MIEAVEFFPGLGGMASLAAQGLAVLPGLRHALFELVVMHVLVTTRARQIVEVIGNL